LPECTINLALQGGGALGAFTWGVLDRLLEEPGLAFEAISGSSAGAMNALAVAHGLAEAGPEGAKKTLEAFWTAVGSASYPVQATLASEAPAGMMATPSKFLLGLIPTQKPVLQSTRGGTSFWVTAGQAGVRSSVLTVPVTFPPEEVPNGELLSGLPLPDIGASPEDRHNLNLLVAEFRRQLNAYADAHGRNHRDFLLTAALPAGRWQDSGNGVTGAPFDANTSFDLATLGRTLDNINLMTYDMGTGYSPVSMFNQPLYRHSDDPTGDPYNNADDAVRYFIAHGVPRAKISLGVEFTLSRGFGTTGLYQPWTSTGCGQTTARNALDPANTSILINWDPQVQSQYLWNPSAQRMCSYENAYSLELRSDYAKQHGLSGIFTWELSGDASGSQLRAVARPWEPAKVVAAPAPTVRGATFYPHAGQSFSGAVATVSGSSAGSLTAIINWGDQTRSPGTVTPTAGGFAISGDHTYSAAGAYRLTATVIDPDPVNSRMVNGYAFVDSSPYAYVKGLVDAFSTNRVVAFGLDALLTAASRAPNRTARAHILDAFIQLTRVQTGKAITPGQAEALTQLAESLRST